MANEYLTFAAPSLDTFTAAQWATYTGLLANGFATGLADTTEVNTLMRQLSVPVSALGQYISDAGYNALDNGSRSDFQNAFANALKKNLLSNDQATWIQDKGGNNRLFMATSGTTTWKGYGTTPVTFQNAAGTTILAANNDGRITGGANATSGLDLITYQQWAAGNNQYTNIISIPGSRASTYYMTTAEYGSLVVINDQFAYNVVLPTAVGAAGKTIRIYNNARVSVGLYAPNAPTELLFGPGLELDYAYAGAHDYCGGNMEMLPRQDYTFISDGTNWITLAGATNRLQGNPNIVTRANYLAGNTSYTIKRRQSRILKVTLVGAGGGGGGNGGGGSGAVVIVWVYGFDVSSTAPAFTFTIGGGGTRGPIQGTNGGATTLSYTGQGIAWTYTAGGGFAGGASGAGQQGGAGGVGSITGLDMDKLLLRGNPGGNGTPGDTSLPGVGGATPLFGGGGCGTLNGTATRDGINGGGGAGGGLSAAAGLGGDGFIIFEEF
jgi:hypothetical protein